MYHGDIDLGATIDLKFTTRQFSTGAPFALVSGTIAVYVANSATPVSPGGVVLTVNLNSVTGLNNVRIVASSGNGYSAGNEYAVVLSGGTVDSVSVTGEVVGSFSIVARSALRPTTAGRTLTVETDGMGHADLKEWLGTAPSALLSGRVDADARATVLDPDLIAHTVAGSLGRIAREGRDYGFYQNGAVWVDNVRGTAGNTPFINGTNRNPCTTMADANTIASGLALSRYEIAPGAAISLAASQQNQLFFGYGATINLSAANIAGSVFIGATINGNGTGTQPRFRNCSFSSTTTVGQDAVFEDCVFAGTITLGASGTVVMNDCRTAVIGVSPAILDFGTTASQNNNVNLRNYSGHVEVRNLGQSGTDRFFMEGIGDLTLASTCIGGEVTIRGIVGLTNQGSGMTLDQDQRVTNRQVTDFVYDELTSQARLAGSYGQLFKDNINASIGSRAPEAGGNVASIKAKTDQLAFGVANTVNANLEAINAAVAEAVRFRQSLSVMYRGTVAASPAPSTTSFADNGLTQSDNDHWKGRVIIFETGVLKYQATVIETFTAATDVLGFTGKPLTQSPSAGDAYVIV